MKINFKIYKYMKIQPIKFLVEFCCKLKYKSKFFFKKKIYNLIKKILRNLDKFIQIKSNKI